MHRRKTLSQAPKHGVAIRRWTICSLCVLSGVVFRSGPVLAGDWPQWRGPQRDGRIADFEPPQVWPKQLRQQWSLEVGEGHASPVVAAGRAVIHARQSEEEHVRCVDLKTGATLWLDRYAAPGAVHPAGASHGLGPKSTPAIAGGRVYTLGIGSILTCYDLETGRIAWRKDYRAKFRQPAPSCGTSMSPLVIDGLCIVHVGVDSRGEMIALDAQTGQPRWTYDGDGPGYGSPIVIASQGERQIAVLVSQAVVGVALNTGRAAWRYPFRTTYTQNIATPVWHDGTLIVGGIGQPTMAMRVPPKPGAAVEQAWSNDQTPLHMSSPVLVGDRLFGFSQRKAGSLFCLDAATGRIHWQSEGRLGDNAALLHAGSVLVVLQSTGQLTFARTDAPAYQPIATYRVSKDPTWAHPALAKDRILVKDAKALICWSLAP